jgi:transcriptional regulator of nitric oxide reductase
MEFVIVTFPVVRAVIMDGAPEGQTGELIGVERGTHRFDLGEPTDYQPLRRRVRVTNTTQLTPMEIAFDPVVDDLEAPAAQPEAAPVRRARRRTKKKPAKTKKDTKKMKKAAKKTKKASARGRSRKRSHGRAKRA